MTVLALVLGRSITRPLTEVSEGAKALADGDLSYDVRYTGRDEIGVVADTFRELHVTSERLAAEIRTMNTAIDDNRLGHRADVAAFDGTWAQLLGGMNGTMASFAAAHGRRRKAERELASIFNLSLDLLCICGTDGYFKRAEPGLRDGPSATPAARCSPGRSWSSSTRRTGHARRAVLDSLANGAEVAEFENRYVRADGTERWLQWSCPPGRSREGLIYAAARDVTESRRADREQAALRSVATLVARGDPPHEVFTAVAHEVGLVLSTGSAAVLRYEADGAVTVLGSARTAATDGRGGGRGRWPTTAGAVRVGRSVGAPIVVDDRLWGAVVAAAHGPGTAAPGNRVAARGLHRTRRHRHRQRRQPGPAERLTRARGGRSDASRRRIERDLHDGVQQRLVSLQLDLRTAESMMEDRSADALRAVGAHRQGPRRRLRGPAADLPRHPPRDPLQGRPGPRPASPRPPLRRPRGAGSPAAGARLPERTEVAVYYVTSECLTNAAKHARATVVQVEARTYDDVLEVVISDDGSGGADPGGGSGLIGLIDRVEAIGGRLTASPAHREAARP